MGYRDSVCWTVFMGGGSESGLRTIAPRRTYGGGLPGSTSAKISKRFHAGSGVATPSQGT